MVDGTGCDCNVSYEEVYLMVKCRCECGLMVNVRGRMEGYL